MMFGVMKRYGIDAPGIVINLAFSGLLMCLLSLATFFIESRVWFWIAFLNTSLTGIALLSTAGLMIYSSTVLKPKILLEILESVGIEGSERILDVGCGRGMFLIMAAKRLTSGKAHGIDLWHSVDQSGNSKEKTLQNVWLEGLQEKVAIETSDMRRLPYSDGNFDLVISSLAIHNIAGLEGQKKAVDEVLRVLKPGGKFALFDILSIKEYGKHFALRGCSVQMKQKFYCPGATVILGKKGHESPI